ncbi:MATE family efflux transporter [Sediminitomix flava]|uniref:MATE family multidrug resistance protein n=1 Tax=Sediminitomix flava TaxID=379075 RepID=A0A315Z739_SEDFL|nr:MATE family efflux transporter [Sediminitomix flava]PWJ40227.1 MATE family multidrug resistance protein [Sediminitomix flava]
MDKQILRLAIPNIISNITIPLLGLVDMALLGHLDSEVYLGAVALGTIIFNFLYWSFGFLRMGTTGFTAQAYGQKNFELARFTLLRGLVIAAVGSLALILLQVPIEYLSFKILKGSDEVVSFAQDYFYIRIYAAPATIGLYALLGWQIGMQNARYPMIITILGNVLNLGFSAWFIYGLGMKSDGAALGTVVAQYIGFAVALYFSMRIDKDLFKAIDWKKILHKSEMIPFFKMNRDIFLRTLLLILVLNYFTAVSAESGDLILASNTLLLQYSMFFSYLIDGVAYAGEALTGKYIGESDFSKLKTLIKKLLIYGTILSLIFSLVYYVFGIDILRLLTSNEKIINQSMPFMKWVILIPIVSFASYVWDGVYIGATAGKEMLITMVLSAIIFFFIPYFILKPEYANHGLWISLLIFLFGRGFLQTIFWKRINVRISH